MELENKSYRGKLVKVIVESFIIDYQFELSDKLKEILQERLDLNLKFETKVSEIEIKNEHSFGQVYFNCEKGDASVIDFTVTNSSVD